MVLLRAPSNATQMSHIVVYLALFKITLICVQICIYCYVRMICYIQYMHVVIYIYVADPSDVYLHEDQCTSPFF